MYRITSFLLLFLSSFLIQAGNPDLFYYVSDATDELYTINRTNGTVTLIGSTGVTAIEAIAYYPAPGANVLYAANAGDFGTLNITTGAYTSIGEIDGGGTANGSAGAQSLDDVDGLMLDGQTFIMWAIERKAGTTPDLLFQIDVSTGRFIPNAFGAGIDYLVITGTGVDVDADDLAVDPTTGFIYASSNSGGTGDVLVRINKYTGVFTAVATLSQDDIEGLAFSSDGTLYGSEGDVENRLGEINISTGVLSNFFSFTGSDVEALATLTADANQVSGTVFDDTDKDGIKDGGETGVANIEVNLYIDLNANGTVDPEDTKVQSVLTDVNGDYSFNYVSTGSLLINTSYASFPASSALTTDNIETATFADAINFGETDTQNDFGIATGPDCDSDGIPNFYETAIDSDADGILDSCDLDSDNDGILDSVEGIEDFDNDGILNYLDRDSDDDGIPDAIEANGGLLPTGYDATEGNVSGTDSDGNGIIDSRETFAGSGIAVAPLPDSDNDGLPDYLDLDSDNDGILDIIEAGGEDSDLDGQVDGLLDADNNGYDDRLQILGLTIDNTDVATEDANGLTRLPNYIDLDSDADGIDDTREAYSTNAYEFPTLLIDSDEDGIIDFWDISAGEDPITPYDRDGDGVPDYKDLDSDNDGVSDFIEGNDANSDGIADATASGLDDNNNGVDDVFDSNCSQTISIGAADWAEENNADGSMYLTSTDLELVNDGAINQTVGMYFSGIPLAQGATVNSAYLQFQTDEVSTGTINLTIAGELNTNASSFTATTNDVSSRTTTGSIGWSPADWNTIGESAAAQQSSDISTIVNTILGQGGWASGNNMVFVITGPTGNRRTAEVNPFLNLNLDAIVCSTNVAHQDFDGDGEDDFRDIDDDADAITTANEIPDADGSGTPDYLETDTNSCGVGFVEDTVISNQTTTANVVSETNVGVTNSTNVVGPVDGNEANVELGDTLIMDFADTVLNATSYTITWGRQTANGSNAVTMTVEESFDGISWTTNGTSPSTSSKTAITTSFTAGIDFRYLRITSSSPGLDVDAAEVTVNAIDTTINCIRDSDNDGRVDTDDIDDDDDGILDVNEGEGSNNPVGDEDGDGVLNYLDTSDDGTGDGSTTSYVDSNGDGIPDVFDSDGDGVPNHLDIDSDNDGIYDIIEAGGVDNDGDGRVDNNTDTDQDGWADTFDADNGGVALDDTNTDGDAIENRLDLDSDNDGVVDIIEAGGVDANNDGRVDNNTDTDGDGYADTFDPDNAGTSLPVSDFDGDGIANYLDLDADGDGISDNVEAQTTAAFVAPTGNDTDGDGWDDAYDSDNGGTAITLSNNDGFGQPDYLDLDSDADGSLDWLEGFDSDNDGDALNDLLARASAYETAAANPSHYVNTDNADGDDFPDWLEDDDVDNVPNFLDPDHPLYIDTDGDGIVNLYDADNSGVASNTPDLDGDGEYDFRDFDNSISLPIELLYFDAIQKGSQVELSWASVSEINNDYYVILRSNDGKNFKAIHRESGAGNSNHLIKYQAIDLNPSEGRNYYQLVQFDYNGKSAKSEIRVVNFEPNQLDFNVYPNPGEGNAIYLEINKPESGAYQLDILTINGRNILSRAINIEAETLYFEQEILKGLPLDKGFYFIRISSKKGHKVIKYLVR